MKNNKTFNWNFVRLRIYIHIYWSHWKLRTSSTCYQPLLRWCSLPFWINGNNQICYILVKQSPYIPSLRAQLYDGFDIELFGDYRSIEEVTGQNKDRNVNMFDYFIVCVGVKSVTSKLTLLLLCFINASITYSLTPK